MTPSASSTGTGEFGYAAGDDDPLELARSPRARFAGAAARPPSHAGRTERSPGRLSSSLSPRVLGSVQKVTRTSQESGPGPSTSSHTVEIGHPVMARAAAALDDPVRLLQLRRSSSRARGLRLGDVDSGHSAPTPVGVEPLQPDVVGKAGQTSPAAPQRSASASKARSRGTSIAVVAEMGPSGASLVQPNPAAERAKRCNVRSPEPRIFGQLAEKWDLRANPRWYFGRRRFWGALPGREVISVLMGTEHPKTEPKSASTSPRTKPGRLAELHQLRLRDLAGGDGRLSPAVPSCGGAQVSSRAPLFEQCDRRRRRQSRCLRRTSKWLAVSCARTRAATGPALALRPRPRALRRRSTLEEGWTRIGRSSNADVRLDDPTVSRRHALVVPHPRGRPARSRRPLPERPLRQRRAGRVGAVQKDGDELEIGRYRLYVLQRASGSAKTAGGMEARPGLHPN